MATGMANPESNAPPPEFQGALTFRLPRLIAAVGEYLPQFPHSIAFSLGLNLVLRPLLAPDTLDMLRGRTIGIRIEDAGVDLRVRLGERGFVPVGRHTM